MKAAKRIRHFTRGADLVRKRHIEKSLTFTPKDDRWGEGQGS
jgi:hypothetical protein